MNINDINLLNLGPNKTSTVVRVHSAVCRAKPQKKAAAYFARKDCILTFQRIAGNVVDSRHIRLILVGIPLLLDTAVNPPESRVIYILIPSKHETLAQCWGNVGSPSTTLNQHCPSIELMSRFFWVLLRSPCCFTISESSVT